MRGNKYANGEVIVRQGEIGDCMYIIEAGKVEVVLEKDDRELCVAVLGPGEFFGEMALIDGEARAATVRALAKARVLKVDRREFLAGIHDDASLAFRLIRKLSERTRQLETLLVQAAQKGNT